MKPFSKYQLHFFSKISENSHGFLDIQSIWRHRKPVQILGHNHYSEEFQVVIKTLKIDRNFHVKLEKSSTQTKESLTKVSLYL